MRKVLLMMLLLVGCDDDGTAGDAAAAGDAAVAADATMADDATMDAEQADPDMARPEPDMGPPPFVGPLDDTLRLNHVQARGTHNSFHRRPNPVLHASHDYEHRPLDEQLERQGVRQFELDTHAVIDGAFDVLHIPNLDPETTCLAFSDCLNTMLSWSNSHPGHLPIMIWIEPKDIGANAVNGYETSVHRMLELDSEILAVIPRARIFAPDDLRGEHPDLPSALAADGWPTLGQMRSKFIFSMLDTGDHRAAYREGVPNLAGRLLFVDPDGPEDPAAAFFKINNGGSDAARDRVAEGFIVTSNVDGADVAPEENASRRAAALANGVHFLSTDLPEPSSAEDTNWLEIPGGTPARCNPVTAPEACTSEALEALPE